MTTRKKRISRPRTEAPETEGKGEEWDLLKSSLEIGGKLSEQTKQAYEKLHTEGSTSGPTEMTHAQVEAVWKLVERVAIDHFHRGMNQVEMAIKKMIELGHY